MFGAATCLTCHRFNGEGGGGPDLSTVVGKFSPRDLLETISEPSKSICARDDCRPPAVYSKEGRSAGLP